LRLLEWPWSTVTHRSHQDGERNRRQGLPWGGSGWMSMGLRTCFP
jgi:hypothetical protein